MPRPKLICSRSFRLPQELDHWIERHAQGRRCSVNEIIVSALENEFARLGTYRLDLYRDLMPLLAAKEARSCPTTGPNVIHESQMN